MRKFQDLHARIVDAASVLSGAAAVSQNRFDDLRRKGVASCINRYRIKPGVTGWAQFKGFRGEMDRIGKMGAASNMTCMTWSMGRLRSSCGLSARRSFPDQCIETLTSC